MTLEFLLETFKQNQKNDAIVWDDKAYSYQWLLERYAYWKKQLSLENIPNGAVVVLDGDFSPNSVALLSALIDHTCIIIPLTGRKEVIKQEFVDISQGEFIFTIKSNDQAEIKKHPLQQLMSFIQN